MSMIVSSKRRETLGTGDGGHTYSCAFWRCFLPGCSSAGVGRYTRLLGPPPKAVILLGAAILFPTILCPNSAGGALFSVTSLPLFPGPAAFRAPQGLLRLQGLPSPGGVCHHPSQRYSQPWGPAVCGQEPNQPLPKRLPSHSPGSGRYLWQTLEGEKLAQGCLDPERDQTA